jgi:hypothetical protein
MLVEPDDHRHRIEVYAERVDGAWDAVVVMVALLVGLYGW